MRILSHRGLWTRPEEKNTAVAFERSFAGGFGTETDLRDYCGRLVVSHDPADDRALGAEEFLRIYKQAAGSLPLALNIKADGLRGLLRPLLEQSQVSDYFCFDMSVPETVAYRREGLRFFTRESEFERSPALYESAAGVWLDQLTVNWITPGDIARHLDCGKQVALVSPELHSRPHLPFWQTLRDAGMGRAEGLLLCTDHPDSARQFFND
jgi:glycerophosphoryl diester phosphodiesterase